MKLKLINASILLITLTGLAGCEEKVDYTDESMNFDIDKDLQSALEQNRMPLLTSKLGCSNCHATDHKLVGPAWKDVGKRYQSASTYEYQGKRYPLSEGLVQKISHGGSGNWGVEAMPAMDPSGSKQSQLKKLVGFIMELGKR